MAFEPFWCEIGYRFETFWSESLKRGMDKLPRPVWILSKIARENYILGPFIREETRRVLNKT